MGKNKEENAQALIIDNGTGFTKAGFAGDESPRCKKKIIKKNI